MIQNNNPALKNGIIDEAGEILHLIFSEYANFLYNNSRLYNDPNVANLSCLLLRLYGNYCYDQSEMVMDVKKALLIAQYINMLRLERRVEVGQSSGLSNLEKISISIADETFRYIEHKLERLERLPMMVG